MAPELPSVNDQPDAKFWSLEEGYDDVKNGNNKSALDTYPYRVLGTGSQNGLSFWINLGVDDLDFSCRYTAHGYKVVLHAPAEIPQPSMNFFRLPLEQEVLVSVKPNMLETSDELKNYDSSRKLCYLNSKVQLQFFKVYTNHHCKLECISNHMKKQCDCVFFSYPRKDDTCS